MGTLTCVLVYLLGRRVFGTGIGLGAGLAAALYGPLIYFGGELLPALPAVFLDLLLLYLLCTGSSWWRYLLAGALTGLAALTVANILLFLPVLLGWLYWRDRREGLAPGLSLKSPALLLVGCALLVAPVTLRNVLVGDDFVLISHNAGINFYIGNNADYQATTSIRPGRAWAELVEMPEREAGIEKPSAKSRYFLARSWDFAASEPLAYLKLMAYKAYLFARGDEIPRNLDPYFARNHSQLLSLLLWKHGLAFPFGLVAPLALIGLYAFVRSPTEQTPEGRLLQLFAMSYAVSVVLFLVTARYRLPVVPVLLLFAACGVRALWTLPRPALLSLPVLLLLCNAATGTMRTEGDAHEHYWLGYAYEEKGMPANAARHYRRALEFDPAFEEVLLSLAAIHGEAERYDKAIALYQRYLEHYPDEQGVRFLLGNTCLLARRYREASAIYAEIAAARPDLAAAHGRLAYAHLMAARPGLAAQAYQRTLELNPDSSLVRYQLARLHAAQEQPAEAIDQFRLLVERHPSEPEYRLHLADLLIDLADQGRQGIRLQKTARLDEAETHLYRALELDTTDAHPHWSLGMLYARQERYPEAIPVFEKLIEIAPLDFQVHLFLGHLYTRTGRQDEADAQFETYSRNKRAHHLQKTARREFEAQIEEIFGG